MKFGQKTVIVFISKILNAATAFLATVYFARVLGAEVVGIYAVVIAIVAWTIVFGEAGLGKAITKRVSEGKEPEAYFSAAGTLLFIFTTFISLLIFFGRPVLETYVDGFDEYVSVSTAWILVGLLVARLCNRFSIRSLKGEQKVHIAGLLSTLREGITGVLQISLIAVGFGLFGMLIGPIFGGITASLVGLYLLSIRPTIPQWRHFKSLLNYAKYSWLSSLKARTFNDVDILLLGVFVQSALVGIYSIAWSLARIIELFGRSLSATVFPEVSYSSAQKSEEDVADLIENVVAYTGLIGIPGFVGGTILSERLLRIYGPEFERGATVLSLLLLAVLLRSYQTQFLDALNGVNRPDIAFRINGLFIVLNAGLNVVLIYYYGFEGAAVASIASVFVTLLLAYRATHSLVDFRFPLKEITQQCSAAAVMGLLVWLVLTANGRTGILPTNILMTVFAVGIGCVGYTLALLAISPRFRMTVRRNLPGIA